jgi:ABC-2 type transport system permease protein
MFSLYKKELAYYFKSPRWIFISLPFVFFGLLGPISAKVLPELIPYLSPDLKIILPEPTVIDSYVQFIKNSVQILFYIVLFYSVSPMIKEKQKKTLTLVITKPINRSSIILMKWLAITTVFFIGHTLGTLFFGLYTYLLFNQLDVFLLIQSYELIFIYFMVFFAVGSLMSILSNNYPIALLGTFLVYILTELMMISSYTEKISPKHLLVMAQESLINGNTSLEYLYIVIQFLIIGLVLYLGTFVFKKQELNKLYK